MEQDIYETEFEFASKYETKNPIALWLIDNFFKGVEACVKNTHSQSYHEIGCGEAFSTLRLKKMLPQDASFSAGDIEDKNINAAQKRIPGFLFKKENIYQLPYEDNSIDTLFTLEVLEHLDEPEKALKEILRVSAKDAIVSIPREPLWRGMNFVRGKNFTRFGDDPGHIQHWGQRSFKKFISKHAKILQVQSPLPWTVLRITGK